MRTKFVDACLKVESRYPTGGIDGAVQNNRTIGVIQGDFSREASLLVFSIQSDIFVIVVAVINGGNQPFQQYGWVLVFVMAAVDIQIESYFTQFFVTQHLAQLKLFGFHCTGIGKITFIFVRT